LVLPDLFSSNYFFDKEKEKIWLTVQKGLLLQSEVPTVIKNQAINIECIINGINKIVCWIIGSGAIE